MDSLSQNKVTTNKLSQNNVTLNSPWIELEIGHDFEGRVLCRINDNGTADLTGVLKPLKAAGDDVTIVAPPTGYKFNPINGTVINFISNNSVTSSPNIYGVTLNQANDSLQALHGQPKTYLSRGTVCYFGLDSVSIGNSDFKTGLNIPITKI